MFTTGKFSAPALHRDDVEPNRSEIMDGTGANVPISWRHGLLAALTGVGALLAASTPAWAGKVHWKDDPAVPGCSALAFDDTDEWFANAEGYTFKRGICHGQRITFKVTLAPDRQSFTVAGTNLCTFQVGEGHAITASCRAQGAH